VGIRDDAQALAKPDDLNRRIAAGARRAIDAAALIDAKPERNADQRSAGCTDKIGEAR
jgi:hypothetical protein